MNFNYSLNGRNFEELKRTISLEEAPASVQYFKNNFLQKPRSKTRSIGNEKEFALKLIQEKADRTKIDIIEEQKIEDSQIIFKQNENKEINFKEQDDLDGIESMVIFNQETKKRKLNFNDNPKNIKQLKNDKFIQQKIRKLKIDHEEDIEDYSQDLYKAKTEKIENIDRSSYESSALKDKIPAILTDRFFKEEENYSKTNYSSFLGKIKFFEEKFGIYFIKIEEIQFININFSEFNKNFKRSNGIYNPHNPLKNPVYKLECDKQYLFEFKIRPRAKKGEVLLFLDGIYNL